MIVEKSQLALKYPTYTFNESTKIEDDIITPISEDHCLIRNRADIHTLEDVRVAVIGNVDAGKSTILGVLTKGSLDDGRGKARQVLFKHKHELLTGRTSSVGMECMGFDEFGAQVIKNEHHKMTWDQIALNSSKMITFIDLAGHEKYLKTTVYGLSSSQPDYAMLMVGANAGMIGMTKEHLGLTLLLNIPSMIVVTKIDMAPPNVLKSTVNQLQKILKSSGCRKMPIFIRTKEDVIKVAMNLSGERICPVFMVSNVTGDGIELLRLFLNVLPSRQQFSNGESVEYEITESFSVPGVGCVVSGQILSGVIKIGDNLLLGPDKNGQFFNTQVKGIHRKRVPINIAHPGQSVSLALKKIKRSQIRKGMVLVSKEVDISSHVTREFEAEILVLHHSTTIAVNYQTMLHARKILLFRKCSSNCTNFGHEQGAYTQWR
eukprot:NODE_156_length_15158_cov_0.791553.p4 type:complete len:432 gc:universal NODE_156_length_15158_cov_0.791553:4454-3159(-)